MAEEKEPVEKPAAWLVGFDERKQRNVNIALYWSTSRVTGNRFLKAAKLEFLIPAGTILHVFKSGGYAEEKALEF
jgi:hypothetical protein